MLPGRVVFPLLLLGLAPEGLAAQGWTASIAAGTTTHESVAADPGSGNAIIGLRRDGDHWLFLNGGLPWDSAGVPWAAAGFGGAATRPVGPAEAGLYWTAHGHLYQQRETDLRGTGLTAALLPQLAFTSGRLRAEVYSGPLIYRQSLDAPGFQEDTLRTLHDSGARILVGSPEWLASADLRYLREGSQAYPWAGASLAFSRGPLEAWMSGGYWDTDADASLSWSVGGAFDLGQQSRLTAGFSSHAPDPIYWNSARRSWTLGLERRLSAPAPVAPVAVVAQRSGEQVEISIPRSDGAALRVAGDFTGWEAVPMTVQGDQWVARFALESGIYHYAFVDANGVWFVPDHLPAVDDGMGGESAVLIVQ